MAANSTQQQEITSSEERLHPVAKAFEIITGRRPAPATCFRWRTRGLKGIRLETALYLGQQMIPLRAAREFLDATSGASEHTETPQSRTPRAKEAAIAKAERMLKELGV